MRTHWLAMAVLVGAAALWACGGSSKNQGGKSCTSDADCGSGQICHPLAKVCVQTCTSGADCPSTAKNCAVWVGPNDAGTTSASICECSTDELCGGGTGSTVICGIEDKICETKCGSNADCSSGRSCDTSTSSSTQGQCFSLPASCTPACTGSQYCDTSQSPPACVSFCTPGSCTGGNICDYGTGRCVAAAACNTANPQPDVCGYGDFCNTTASCLDVPPPTCSNFTPSAHANTWAVAANTPVVYSMVPVGTATPNSAFCGGTLTRFKAHVMAYDPTGSHPASDACPDPTGANQGSDELAMQNIIHLVDPSGTEITTTNTVQNVCTTNSGKNAEFDVNFCVTGTATTYSAGIHFWVNSQSGNEYCATLQ